MSEEFWSRMADHLIQAFVTISLALIAAMPTIVIGWLKLRKLGERVDEVKDNVDHAAIAASKANVAAVTAAKNAAAATKAAVESKDAAIKTITGALDEQTMTLKEAIKGNGGPH
jgi:uncharacterized membrane protein YcjF (UPF0283 family)